MSRLLPTLLCQGAVVGRPLCPTLVHDEGMRIFVCLALAVFSALALVVIMRHFDSY